MPRLARSSLVAPVLFLAAACAASAAEIATAADTGLTVLAIDAAADRQPINPEIYGVAFASETDLAGLNATLNRQGGNIASRYNWKENASNHAADWFFESLPQKGGAEPGAVVDLLVAESRAARAGSMVTVPINGWVAKLGPDRGKLWSFSIAKYGPQTAHEPNDPVDAGNGIRAGGSTSPSPATTPRMPTSA